MRGLEGFTLIVTMCLVVSRGQTRQMRMIHLDNRAEDEFPSHQDRYTKSASLIPNDQLNVLPPSFVLCLRPGEASNDNDILLVSSLEVLGASQPASLYYEFGFLSLYLYVGALEFWYDGSYGAGDSLSFHLVMGGQYHNLGHVWPLSGDRLYRLLRLTRS